MHEGEQVPESQIPGALAQPAVSQTCAQSKAPLLFHSIPPSELHIDTPVMPSALYEKYTHVQKNPKQDISPSEKLGLLKVCATCS